MSDSAERVDDSEGWTVALAAEVAVDGGAHIEWDGTVAANASVATAKRKKPE